MSSSSATIAAATTGGAFVHRSPLSTPHHDPFHSLASNIVREYFGPTVQCVADCLLTRCCGDHDGEGAGLTLRELEERVVRTCRRSCNEDRSRLVREASTAVSRIHGRGVGLSLRRSKGTESEGWLVEGRHVRAGLLVLVQHSLVDTAKEKKSKGSSSTTWRYRMNLERARCVPRYCRYVEHAREVLDENAATVVECVLLNGRLRSEDVLRTAVDSVHELLNDENDDENDDEEEDEEDEETKRATREAERAEIRKGVLQSFRNLIDNEFLETVTPLEPAETPAAAKKRKRDDDAPPPMDDPPARGAPEDDPADMTAVASRPPLSRLPGAVWRVNVRRFHDALRAARLGTLVGQIHGRRVEHAGAVVAAALAAVRSSEEFRSEGRGVVAAEDVEAALRPSVAAGLRRDGGSADAVREALRALAAADWPPVTTEVEGGRFEMATRQMCRYLQGRVHSRIVADHLGEAAARACAALEVKGWLECEAVAKAAMVPAQSAREVLNALFVHGYAQLMPVHPTQAKGRSIGNLSTAICLWTVDRDRLERTINDNVCQAYLNLRLRRQHEMEVGKGWIEREKELAADASSDENLHEEAKLNYERFCKGLMRLDTALLQLDETLMVLKDFSS